LKFVRMSKLWCISKLNSYSLKDLGMSALRKKYRHAVHLTWAEYVFNKFKLVKSTVQKTIISKYVIYLYYLLVNEIKFNLVHAFHIRKDMIIYSKSSEIIFSTFISYQALRKSIIYQIFARQNGKVFKKFMPKFQNVSKYFYSDFSLSNYQT